MVDEEGLEIHENFLWENQPWGFLNTYNFGEGEEKSDKKLLYLSSNSPQVVVATPSDKKRVLRNGKGSGVLNEGKGGGCGESDHEIHIWTERERRKKMRTMFSNLHALLPQLSPKADKSTIVDEAVNYIKTLQNKLHKLQKQKVERLQGFTTNSFDPSMMTPSKLPFVTREAFLADQGSSGDLAIPTTNSSNSLLTSRLPIIFQTWTSPNVTLNICGSEAQINVYAAKRPGLLTSICFVLEKHKLEVLSAHISSDHKESKYMIHAQAIGTAEQFIEPLPVEEIYKQAAAEILLWVSS